MVFTQAKRTSQKGWRVEAASGWLGVVTGMICLRAVQNSDGLGRVGHSSNQSMSRVAKSQGRVQRSTYGVVGNWL